MSDLLPGPTSNPDSQAYWDAAQEERLVIRKCNACGQPHFMPRYLCPSCWSTDLEWVQASGRGTVHSYSIVRRASAPEFASQVPYVIALIDLAEGPRMMANILGDDALQTRIGDQVEVCFQEREGGRKIPQFRRVPGGKEH